MKTDNELQQVVTEVLKWEPSLDHGRIVVAVAEGVTTLSGLDSDHAQKVAAENAAFRVMTAKAITEEIQIPFGSDSKTSDPEIAERILGVLAAIKRSSELDVDATGVNLDGGALRLSGPVHG